MRYFTLLFALWSNALVFGQINVVPTTEAYKVETAVVNADVPPGATFTGGWEVDDGVSFIAHDPTTIHWTATPGKHEFKYTGFWIHTKTVTFKDGDGNTITIESYLGSGLVNEAGVSTVTGGTDPVPPQPPGPVDGPQHIVFFLDQQKIDEMPYAQRYIIISRNAREDLERRGHKFLITIDDDQLESLTQGKWQSWIQAVQNVTLPAVAIAPANGGEIVAYPMPDDYKGLLKLLGESG